MTTTAEGVETVQQEELLRALGCTEMQGYLFSPPESAADIKQLLFAQHQQPHPRAGRQRVPGSA
jgi:EAL domain-containing protein (putative c-di-GMP-specific phosphodiesterase class I)